MKIVLALCLFFCYSVSNASHLELRGTQWYLCNDDEMVNHCWVYGG